MKNLVTTLALLFASSAFGNPFDSFAGDYVVVGSPMIVSTGKINTAKQCIRFNFAYLTGFTVEIDTKSNSFTSDMLYFRTTGGVSSSGWSGHPVMDFVTSPLSYAKSTGSVDFASNKWVQGGGTVGQIFSEPLTVTLRKTGETVQLQMVEEYVENSNLIASCTYEAKLTKK